MVGPLLRFVSSASGKPPGAQLYQQQRNQANQRFIGQKLRKQRLDPLFLPCAHIKAHNGDAAGLMMCICSRYQTARIAVTTWPITVATAAPIMPHLKAKMKIGSRMILMIAHAALGLLRLVSAQGHTDEDAAAPDLRISQLDEYGT